MSRVKATRSLGELKFLYEEWEDPKRGFLVRVDMSQPWVETTYIEDNGLALICGSCDSSDCEHVGLLVEKGGDGQYLHKFPSFTVSLQDIPVGFTSPDQLVMEIEILGERQGKDTRLYLDKAECLADPDRCREGYLGTIRAGEGRRVVRSLLRNYVEFLWFTVPASNRHCTRKIHDSRAEERFQKAVQFAQSGYSLVPMYIQMWSIMFTGACSRCFEVEGAFTPAGDVLGNLLTDPGVRGASH